MERVDLNALPEAVQRNPALALPFRPWHLLAIRATYHSTRMSPTHPRPDVPPFSLKLNRATVRAYNLALTQLDNVRAAHEAAVLESFKALLEDTARPHHWTLVRKYPFHCKNAAPLCLDAVLLDEDRIPRGVIDLNMDRDDLTIEMRDKVRLGYPTKNILFWQPRRALLIQDGEVVFDYGLELVPQQLCTILTRFFTSTEPVIADS